MKLNKIKNHTLEKCYSIAPLTYQGKQHILVAAEKTDRCLLFDCLGNLEDTVWEGPGGTMSMVQVPGSDGCFLATQQFYSPNDSAEAKIVLVTPENGNWKVEVLWELPFVHRFDIITRNHVNYLIACTLKSGHTCKDDWTSPGKIFAAALPEKLSEYKNTVLTPIWEGLYKNHGYCRVKDETGEFSLVASEAGILKITPPVCPMEENLKTPSGGRDWTCESLYAAAVSDMCMVDLDGDGETEIVAISPFHGNTISVLKLVDGTYREIQVLSEEAEFGHSIWGGLAAGKPAAVIGHRKGKRDLLSITFDNEYKVVILDSDVGSANVLKYDFEGREYLVSTNREINEIAFYSIESFGI